MKKLFTYYEPFVRTYPTNLSSQGAGLGSKLGLSFFHLQPYRCHYGAFSYLSKLSNGTQFLASRQR